MCCNNWARHANTPQTAELALPCCFAVYQLRLIHCLSQDPLAFCLQFGLPKLLLSSAQLIWLGVLRIVQSCSDLKPGPPQSHTPFATAPLPKLPPPPLCRPKPKT